MSQKLLLRSGRRGPGLLSFKSDEELEVHVNALVLLGAGDLRRPPPHRRCGRPTTRTSIRRWSWLTSMGLPSGSMRPVRTSDPSRGGRRWARTPRRQDPEWCSNEREHMSVMPTNLRYMTGVRGFQPQLRSPRLLARSAASLRFDTPSFPSTAET